MTAVHSPSDSNAILPVRIGTAIAILATVVAGFVGSLTPSSAGGSPVWWFGAGIIASASGLLGLVFLHRRARKLNLN